MAVSSKPRAPSSHPTHSLLDALRDFQLRLEHLGGNERGMNVLEAYDWFIRESERGRSCPHAMKARSEFMKQDYQDARALFLSLLEHFRAVEGDNFGR